MKYNINHLTAGNGTQMYHNCFVLAEDKNKHKSNNPGFYPGSLSQVPQQIKRESTKVSKKATEAAANKSS